MRFQHQYRDHHHNSEDKKLSIPTRGSSNRVSTLSKVVPPGRLWLYGIHTVRAVLDNPQRRIYRLFATQNAMARLAIVNKLILSYPLELVTPMDLNRKLGVKTVHQGVMVETEPLARIEELQQSSDSTLVLILDKITDPHNVGAIMRSAVAFGADTLITTDRHSPQETAILAKAAAGALEMIRHISVRNLANTIETLNQAGFQTIGLDSQGKEKLEEAFIAKRIALVLGAEGKGLRQKTRQTVSKLVRLEMPGAIKSLNVSNASAIALYTISSKR